MKKTFVVIILLFSIVLCFAWIVIAKSYDYQDVEVYLTEGDYYVKVQGTVTYEIPWNHTNTYIASYQIRNSSGTIIHSNSGSYHTIPQGSPPVNHSETFPVFPITTSGTYYFRGGIIESFATIVISSSATLKFDNSVPPGNSQD
ncbi:MAG: hypothetical protein KAT74_01955 [Candidatus Cloacimonetes bacterium]|jgi:hypothetical protein|nr:hypothetical protein [Candidatus Cloacimonadota bacterium]